MLRYQLSRCSILRSRPVGVVELGGAIREDYFRVRHRAGTIAKTASRIAHLG